MSMSMQAGKAGERARRALGELWVLDDVGVTVRGLLEEAFPGSVGGSYRVGSDGVIANDWNGLEPEVLEAVRRVVPPNRQWDPHRRSTIDERVVSSAEVRARMSAEMWAHLDAGFRPFTGGPYQQCRFTIFRRGRLRGWVGVVAGRDYDFTREERARLEAMRAPIRDHLLALEAVGFDPGSADEAVRALELFASPALLLSEHGQILFANHPARAWVDEAPEALAGVQSGCSSDAFTHHLLHASGRTYRLAVLREPAALGPPSLPPRLAEVLALLLAGKPDKEIALTLGVTTSSARTYVRRLYERLGVHGRGELWQRFGKPRG